MDARIVEDAPDLSEITRMFSAEVLLLKNPDENEKQLVGHPLRGALFETWVISELLKRRYNRALASNLFFWRDRTGNEVDAVLDEGDVLIPVEVKAGLTVGPGFFAGLKRWRELAGEAAGSGWVVYGGDQRQSRNDNTALPWRELPGQELATGHG